MDNSRAWMPMYWGDYLRDTLGLTKAQHGAYILLIAAYWSKGGPLTESEVKAVAEELAPLLARFFDVADGIWHHKRIDAEIAKSLDISAKRQTAGRNAAKVRWQTHSKRIANAYQTDTQSQSHKTVTNNSAATGPAVCGPAGPTPPKKAFDPKCPGLRGQFCTDNCEAMLNGLCNRPMRHKVPTDKKS